MRWTPSVTVAAVVRRQDRFLLVEETPDGQAVLNQPAGHLEFGESLIEAVCREVIEETARTFEPSGLLGVYQWTLPGTEQTYLRFCFVGDVSEPIAGRAIDPDIRATHWLTRAAVANGRLRVRSPLVLRCIDDADCNPPMPLNALHTLL